MNQRYIFINLDVQNNLSEINLKIFYKFIYFESNVFNFFNYNMTLPIIKSNLCQLHYFSFITYCRL